MTCSSYYYYYTNSSNPSAVLADMRKFNPQWAVQDGDINVNTENVASYLCYHGAWTSYLDDSVASYAIGSPSAEMYIDAWNQYKGLKSLDCGWIRGGTGVFDSSYAITKIHQTDMRMHQELQTIV